MHPPPHIARSAHQLHNTKRLQLNAPQYTGRFYCLLTLKPNTFRLTKVNKISGNSLTISMLQNANNNPRLQQKVAELTKFTYNKPNNVYQQRFSARQRSSTAVYQGTSPFRRSFRNGALFLWFVSFGEAKEMNEKLNRLQKAICMNRALIEILKTEPTDTQQKPLNLL